MEYSPKGPKWSRVNQLNQVKQGKDSLWDYIARIKHLNARCEPHKRLSDEQLLPPFLLGLRSPRLHDQVTVLNRTSFETCSKETIRLGDNMREGDKTITTSIPSIVGSKDPDASSSRVSKEQSNETKDLNIDELVDLIVTSTTRDQGHTRTFGRKK